MIDPVTRPVAPAAPATPTPTASTRPDPRPGPEPHADGRQAAAAPASPEPLAIDVARSASGVFVYTLKDPGTGTVLAVIPREDVEAGRDGRQLDQRV